MNILRRAFRRADLPLAFSQGYNPHPIFSMGQPLSVGMTGKGEYFDLELTERIDPDIFIYRVNKKLPDGIKISVAREVPAGIKSLMAVVNRAKYLIKIETTEEDVPYNPESIINKFMGAEEIKVIRKRRKKKDRIINLKPLIDDMEVVNEKYWGFTVWTGSQKNIRPAELIKAVTEIFSWVKEVPLINVEREGLYVKIGEELYDPLSERVVGS